ncbi:DUF2851 family protein [Capnocytophaga cynodegmi]|uniref:DUF2851 domain-containing protein n=1 Tax=Capnocytophaga cynodegmi TaxID=28189 RepID=A0A0B7HP76_9FLAO|nr:DUF2851 family protein [Capnocytophaga cynodegmi]CEN38809.1 conserved hypothetical protein [Capnocytophaga cynodegmi]CEN40459.1 conserved hypothetical protein [Capnocytophaga cynodegmi]
MKEDFLQYLWKYGKIQQNSILTSGETLFIQSIGEHNLLSGPDFFNAQLKIGEQLWAGNVEIHLKSSHWYAHRHEQNKAYNNVILHVVWEHDVEVFNNNQQIIPTLELKNQVDTEILNSYKKLLFSKHNFISCEKYYSKAENMVSSSWNNFLFKERLKQKSDYVESLLKQTKSDWEKVLFLMLLKNFGGTVNGEIFLEMGKTIDFSIIRKERNIPLHLEALFFGQANLLSENYEDFYYKGLHKEYQYLKNKYNLNSLVTNVYFSRLRPQGFPTIRLSQLAQLYEKTENLFSKIIEIQEIKDLREIFSITTSKFWENHYTFGKTSPKTKKKISNSLIELIWINTIIPIKYLYYKSLNKDITPILAKSLHSISPEKNVIIEKFEKLGKLSESAFDTQVILQQYKNYCQHKQCLNCAIGTFLLRDELKN